MPVKSTKTTVAGILVAVGSLIHVIGDALNGTASTQEVLTAVIVAAGALGLGFFARDDNVTSEGTKAQK